MYKAFVQRSVLTASVAVVCVIGLSSLPALAADAPAAPVVKAPARSTTDWTGFYVGGHFGYGTGSFGFGTNPLIAQAVILPPTITGFIGGYQGGYNFQFPNRVVIGLEADLTHASPIDRAATPVTPFNTTFDYFGTARARIGYAAGSFFPYLTAGFAWGQTRVLINDEDGNSIAAKSLMHAGWTAGMGIERVLMGNWTARAEYSYIDLAGKKYGLDAVGLPPIFVEPKLHVFKLGVNYRLLNTPATDESSKSASKSSATKEPDYWSIHGQTTFIPQGYLRFRSPYEGPNSLPGKGGGRESWTTTAFLGLRLWDGGEVYLNPELAQGFGLGSTLGLGGFSNGEAQKGGAPYARIRAQRYFFRQTFGLGGEQETVEDGVNQVAGKRDIDRITLTIGRFPVGDIFDNNTYAKDPRVDFLNWSIWAAAAYDFPADLPGVTRGAVVELNRKDWAVRAGLFQVPEQQNSDFLVFRTGGAVVEFEQRYKIFDQPGKVRVGVFANRGNTGNYREALAIAAADPTVDINDVMVSIRRQRPKQGFYVNAEQALSKDVGVFGRFSWNDGQNEILSFTDIDRSLSGGISIKGTAWGRASDTVGLAGAINGLSSAHRDFLAAGGLGLLVGDGALNYSTEKIFEAYYALSLAKWAVLTFDYQFIVNPAYNADRGPVSIFTGRVHAEF